MRGPAPPRGSPNTALHALKGEGGNAITPPSLSESCALYVQLPGNAGSRMALFATPWGVAGVTAELESPLGGGVK